MTNSVVHLPGIRQIVVAISLSIVCNTYCQNISGKKFHNPLFVNRQMDIGGITVFYGHDGFYYLYGSGDYSRQVLYRSCNLVDWENTGVVPVPLETQAHLRALDQPVNIPYGFEKYKSTTRFWAPMIVKVGENYNMYTSVGAFSGIVCLHSKFPYGPYIFSEFDVIGKVKKLVEPSDVGIPHDVIDPCFVHDHKTGKNYLFFGSLYGIYRVELNTNGRSLAPNYKFELIAGLSTGGGVGGGYEGTMLYFHDDYWYLILSPRNDYRLLCWRSKDLQKDFYDEDGNTPKSRKYGHEILAPQSDDFKTPEGFSLKRAGHSGEIIMDNRGRYFIFCEASVEPKKNSFWRKAVCLTEIKWNEDGWPTAITEGHRVSYENIKPDL